MNILPGLKAGLDAEIIKWFTILTPVSFCCLEAKSRGGILIARAYIK